MMACCYTSHFFTILTTTTIFIAFSSSLASAKTMPDSTISAAPALLPDYSSLAPSSSSSSSLPPALSPDVTPLFPTPGGPELAPSDSSLPTIPSSPSPPNPDALATPGPGIAFSPSGLLPDSSSVRLDVHKFLVSLYLMAFGLVMVFSA